MYKNMENGPKMEETLRLRRLDTLNLLWTVRDI